MGYVRIQREPFSSDAVLGELKGPRVGGVTLYVGTVRAEDDERRVTALHYEAYPEMAQEQLERLRRETVSRFGLVDATIIHRLGRLEAGDDILLVALAGVHRKETYAAIDFLMDRLKEIIPIWKQEESAHGRTWILGEAREPVNP
jgi:molybdopterin synthase catalytic subunit